MAVEKLTAGFNRSSIAKNGAACYHRTGPGKQQGDALGKTRNRTMEIGKKIQCLRREKGLTQEQMAAALGVTSAAVSKWETNAAIPDVAMLCPLARLLGITVDALLDFRPALEQEEINALLEDRRKLFEEKRLEEAVASCEALLREYPDDLRLKCAAAGLYIMYLSASLDTDWMEAQRTRAIALLEQSRGSGDPNLAASARSMLMNLYVMGEKLDKALAILEEEPEAKINTEMARANILLRKGELDEAEKGYQIGLWQAARDAALNLVGLHNIALRREDKKAALERLEQAMEVERVLRIDEVDGAGSLRLLRAEVLCQERRLDEAMEDLTGYVEGSLARWAKMSGGEEIRSAFYDKLNVRASGISAAYLAQNLRIVLEQGEAANVLGDREDFQTLLARLAELEVK